MIDTENLHTASLYINNQLLSRGLLRDGQDIDFANLGLGGLATADSAGQIIKVLNDLILRRDRDAEQRESLSTAMRTLRLENQKQMKEIAQLSEKCVEAQRKSDIAVSSESSLKTQLKSAESAMRGLKEELARTKTLVAQARTSCATEIRRRDRQIDSLKKQVGEAGRARGAKPSSAITTISITGDFNNEAASSFTHGGDESADDYSLRSETNSFLAKLAQDLSEENEALLGLIGRTKDQLRQMSGWVAEDKEETYAVKQPTWKDIALELETVMDHMRTILTNPSFVPIEEVVIREEEINRLKTGWLKMESRWEDAVRLMDGWRKRMALSGEPICEDDLRMGLHLSPVRVSNVAETREGREPGLPALKEESDEDMDLVQSPCPAQGPHQVMVEEGEETHEDYDDSESDRSDYDDDVDELNGQVEEMAIGATDEDVKLPVQPIHPPPEPRQHSPLRHSTSAGNRGPHNSKVQPAPINRHPIVRDNTRRPANPVGSSKPPQIRNRPAAQPPRPGLKAAKAETQERSVSTSSLDAALLSNGRKKPATGSDSDRLEPAASQDEIAHNESGKLSGLRSNPRRGPLRLSKPRASDPQPQQTPPTRSSIAEKLAASEKEADAARVRAKLKASRVVSGGVQRPVIAPVEPESSKQEVEVEEVPEPVNAELQPQQDGDPVKRDPSGQEEQPKPEKRKRERRTAKASSRRRSTLSPLELQSLISGSVQ